MAQNFGIGGQEVKQDASEALNEIPQNRTLIAAKLTPNMPVKPAVVEGLKNIEEVFEYFNPTVDLEFEDKDGGNTKEQVAFKSLGDFGKKGIIANSDYLQSLQIESEQYKKIIKQLKTNKILKAALEDPEAKKSLIDTLDILAEEIKNAG